MSTPEQSRVPNAPSRNCVTAAARENAPMRPSSRVQQTGPPTRGSIFYSSPSSVASQGPLWIVLNILLFLGPALVPLFWINLCGLPLSFATAGTPFELGCVTVYFIFAAGFLALLYGWLLFPVFLHYHRIINLWAPPRKRRWSWTQITWRRRRQWKTLMERHPQTIFVSGFNARTLALTVTPDMSIEDVHRALQSRGALQNWAPWQRPYYFRNFWSPIDIPCVERYYRCAQLARVINTAASSTHLGWKQYGSASASASAAGNALPVAGPSGTRTSTRERNTKVYEQLVAEERLDADGKPRNSDRQHRKRQRKHKGSRNAPIDITDASDEDFSGDEGSGQSGSESDSDEGAQLSNGEVADSLPSMTNISSRSRKAAKGAGKAKAPATRKPRKKRQRKQATAADDDELPIPAATSSSIPTLITSGCT
ncbi:hypothetical protein B0H14DRAFT_3448129 [Mycena olivaceomarginata]|nr:hypothetical protein B0H14DRAFT_3448129 [Mycena olivaceomarginata]